jgi:hypothetical protein
MKFKIGDLVKCGRVKMSRYVAFGGDESRWFTGCEGYIVSHFEDVYPESYLVSVANKEIMLANDEMELAQ